MSILDVLGNIDTGAAQELIDLCSKVALDAPYLVAVYLFYKKNIEGKINSIDDQIKAIKLLTDSIEISIKQKEDQIAFDKKRINKLMGQYFKGVQSYSDKLEAATQASLKLEARVDLCELILHEEYRQRMNKG